MLRPLSICFLLTYLSCVASVSLTWAASEDPVEWTPATVYSIQVGTSLVGDLTRAIGKPKEQTDNENLIMRGASLYRFEVSWPFEGELWATVDSPSKRVLELWFKSKKARMSEVIKEFGSDYGMRRYRVRKCENDPHRDVICPDSKGPILIFEYPKKGIVVFPGPDGTLNDLYFVSGPLRLLSCDCGDQDDD